MTPSASAACSSSLDQRHHLWESRSEHPEVLGHSLVNLAALPSAGEVMRCPTAVLPNRGVRGAHEYRRTCWSDNPSRARKEAGPTDFVADQRCIRAGRSLRRERAFLLVRGRMVGLGGVEPPTSSLSAIGGSPLCNPAFWQVVRIRNRRSNALFERAAEGRSRLAREVRPQGSRHSHSHPVLALKVPLTCTKPLPDQPIQHPIPRPGPPLLNLLTIRQQTHSP